MDRAAKVIQRESVYRWVEKAYLAGFPGSKRYWEARYRSGRSSGTGSYGRLAEFKTETIEEFIAERDIQTVIDFGCGDGNQIELIEYPDYVGLDVSPTAVRICKERFEEDDNKSFFLYDPTAFHDNNEIFQAEMTQSLDVIYHLTEDEIFHEYMTHLFDCSTAHVVIYSTNLNEQYTGGHVRHRRFTDWTDEHATDWKLAKHIENRYPPSRSDSGETSRAEFYVFEKS